MRGLPRTTKQHMLLYKRQVKSLRREIRKIKLPARLFAAAFIFALAIPGITQRIHLALASTQKTIKYTAQCEFHNIYSPQQQTEITAFIEQEVARRFSLFSGSKNLVSELTNRFDIIDKVSCQLSTPEQVLVTVYGVQPLCKANNNYIIGTNYQVYPKEYFESYTDPITLSLKVPESTLATSRNMSEFIKNINQQTWEHYHVEYTAQSNVILRPKHEDERYFALVSVDTLDDPSMLKRLTESYKEASSLLNRASRKQLVLDYRSGSMNIRAISRGRGNETVSYG